MLSILIFLISVFGHSLTVMAAFTKRLPVRFIPEQLLIPSVRHDMVNHLRLHEPPFLLALLTQRMPFQKTFPRFPPPAVIPTPGSIHTVSPVQCRMFLTELPVRQLRASRMPARLLRSPRHDYVSETMIAKYRKKALAEMKELYMIREKTAGRFLLE